ncbi:MAG: serine O-acetyltransferase [Peptococcaceae bacterium]|nr:serine O-acetyltransferase [Peptococcaceae bacterium]
MNFIKRLKRDIEVVFERDPAATSWVEVVLNYPGLHAIWAHRLTHALYLHHHRVSARFLSQVARFFTQVEIHPGAVLGEGLFIDHGCGIVIGETAVVGKNVTLYQGVTLGGTGKESGKRHPNIGDNVMISSGAKVLGNINIGSDVKIGAGSVVLKDVPDNCTVVGVPGRIVIRDGNRVKTDEHHVDLNHNQLPDPVDDCLRILNYRVDALSTRLKELEEKL